MTVDDVMKAADEAIECASQCRDVLRKAIEAAITAERERIVALLVGIDQTEIESDVGWWETSTGAEFGARVLATIKLSNVEFSGTAKRSFDAGTQG